ncbi:zinc ribbon domain-containing protein [Pseudonocardia sulfidoxydans]
MSQTSASAECATCGSDARRIYGAPALRGVDSALRRALDGAEASADTPPVVSSAPGRSRTAFDTSNDPRHARLPRP